MTPTSGPSGSTQEQDDLGNAKDLLRATLDSSTDMIQVFRAVRNEQGEIIDFTWILNNHAAEKVYGDVLGKSLLELQPGVVIEGIFDAFKQVVETGESQQHERHYVHEQFDGWFHQSAVKLNDGVVTTTADISARKKAEFEILDQAHFIRSVTDTASAIISITEFPSGATVFFNRDPYLKLGFDADELVQMRREDRLSLVHPDDVQKLRDYYTRFIRLSDDDEVRVEYRLKNKEGQWLWLDTRGKVFQRDGEGKVLQLLHIAQDITAKKEADAEILRLKNEAVQTLDKKYQTLVNSIYQGFALCELVRDQNGRGIDHRVLEHNPAFERQTGISIQILHGRTAREAFPTLDQWWTRTYTSIVDSGTPVSFEHYLEETGRWYEIGGYPMQGDQFAVLYNDITERKTAEQHQAFLLKLSDTLRTEPTAAAVANCAIRLLIEQLGLDRSYITTYYLEKGRADLDYQIGNDTVPPLPDHFVLSDYPDAFKTTFEKTVVIEDDWERQGLSEEEKRNSKQLGMRAMMGATLRKENKPMWSMVAISSRPRKWTNSEITLLEEVAERTWFAIERVTADEALRKSEENYRSLFNTMEEGLTILGVIRNDKGQIVDLTYLETNPAFEKHTGLDTNMIIGKLFTEVLPKEDMDRWVLIYIKVMGGGEPYISEEYVAFIDRWFIISVYPRSGDKIAVFYRDITQRKRHEQQQDYFLRLNDGLRPLVNPIDIQRVAMQILGEYLAVDRAIYAEINIDEDWFEATDNYVSESVSKVTGHFPFAAFGPAGEKLKKGENLVIHDVSTEVDSDSQKAFYSIDVHAVVAVPLIKNGKLVADLSVHQTTPRHWFDHEVALLYETAERTWAAVERAKAEEQLRRSQNRFQSIANLVPDLLWDSQPDGSTNWYNQQWLEYTGQRFEEATGWGWLDAIHPDDREGSAKRYAEAVETGKPLRQEHRIRRHDGEYRWFVVNALPFKDEHGRVIKMYGAATDIHESIQAQETLRRREAELARVQQIGLIGGVDVDVANQLTGKRSPEYLRLHGLPADTKSETHEDWLRRLHPDDRQRAEQTLFSALRSEQSGYESEYRIVRPNDGRLVWIYAKLDIERNTAGAPVRLVGVHIDITWRKQAEEALKEADRRKDEFLAMLAHELRNPISTVKSGLSILKITQQNDSEISELVGMMDTQTSHLVRMIDDLLDVSRVTQGKIELKLERLEISHLIETTIKAILPQFESRRKILHTPLISPGLFVNGDVTRLSQVVTNLLTNSLRYTGDDGQVWVSLAPIGHEAVIRVKDNGIGLSTQQQTSVFELFVQGDNSLARTQGGLGIGLTLVKRLVEMHGGRVEAKSQGIGKGSEFRVYLPLLDLPKQEYAPTQTSQTAKSSPIRILVIDDVQDLAKMTSMLLKLKGYEVDIRNNGYDGAEAVETFKPQVVLCDIGMPELDGYQTAALIRQGTWGRQVTLIALSGYGQEEDKRHAREAGFDEHLIKPIEISDLESLIVKLTI